MRFFHWRRRQALTMLVCTLALLASPTLAAQPDPGSTASGSTDPGPIRSAPDLSLKRYVAAGERAYVIGVQDGTFPPMGWHIRGEMGGVWAHPIKLLDGYWFALNNTWLSASRFSAGPGYVQLTYPRTEGLTITRTEVALDDSPAVLIGLTLSNPVSRTQSVRLTMDMHSELMAAYPWGWSMPQNAKQFNAKDTVVYDSQANILTFREPGKPWYALVSSSDPHVQGRTGNSYWGPVAGTDHADYSEFGNGTGARLRSQLQLKGGEQTTIWYAVAGSHTGRDEAAQALRAALADPQQLLRTKIQQRQDILKLTRVQLPDRQLQAAFDWGKLNMADLRLTVTEVNIRDVDEGKTYSPTITTIPRLTGIGAGFPDYPWLFGTDGAYTAYPLVVSGQWDTAISHLRAIRDVSRAVNGDSGKVVHEVVTDGSVYFGTNTDAGNTNETAQFASAVALIWQWSGDDAFRDEMYDFIADGMRYLTSVLDQDGDGFPEGLGMVERQGMGSEKLDVTAYTWQALDALARMAESKGDGETATWARGKAKALADAFDSAWWIGSQELYADSLCNAGDQPKPGDPAGSATNICTQAGQQLQQRHWINATPMEAGLAPAERGVAALGRLEGDTFTGDTGLFHTGVGGGPEGKGELKVWTLPNSVMAVAEANYGRLGDQQALKYMRAIAEQLDLEMPGALPEIAPSPEYEPFVDFRERAMFMQAWSSYGTQWPVIHHFLGIRPDVPSNTLTVVPDIPESWPGLSVRDLRVGKGSVAAEALRRGDIYTTTVTAPAGWQLIIGQTLPPGAEVAQATLDGTAISDYDLVNTLRGRELRVSTTTTQAHTLTVTLR